ncbi:hypothetical protein [Pararhizobium sp.]|uniref:hypothetical protein n=1 Tax=Pararhizobium sp. TaxID=1977563 RepID=UPI00271BA50E|nr:hypothetical protein [Pararhizobium sp.]MDO9417183.1 hypothetical protein [Pararhizobium sp.]
MRLTVLAMSALSLLFALPGYAQERVHMPATSWSVVPPAGFVLPAAAMLPMFEHPSGATMIILDASPERIDMAKLGTVGETQGEGDKASLVKELREITVGGRRGVLKKEFMTVRKTSVMTVVIEGEVSGGVIVAAVPDAALKVVSLADVEASLMSAIEVGR